MSAFNDDVFMDINSRINNGYEIYIGDNFHRKLIQDIYNSEREVLLMTSFLNEDLIEVCMSAHEKGVNVMIILLGNEAIDRKFKSTFKKRKEKKQRISNFNLSIRLKIISFLELAFAFSLSMYIIFFRSMSAQEDFYLIIICIFFYLHTIVSINNRRKIIKAKQDRLNKEASFFNSVKLIDSTCISGVTLTQDIYLIDTSIAFVESSKESVQKPKLKFRSMLRVSRHEVIPDLVQLFKDIFYDDTRFPNIGL